MADIRIESGKAWLGVGGFGVSLKVFGQAPGSSAVLLGYTTSDNPGSGLLGDGAFASTPWYLGTNGIGTYKVWAEHPDDAGVKSNEESYDFDPDHYSGPGDPFDWNGDAIVANDLIVPAIYFRISGRIAWIYGTSLITDNGHLVISPSNTCDTTNSNRITAVNTGSSGTVYTSYSDQYYAFRSNIGTTTFYVFFRDHNCSGCSQIRQVNVSSGGSYNIADLTCP
jgi:hypothetical protein